MRVLIIGGWIGGLATALSLHDVGISWSDIAHEVEKPFWRA